MPKSHNRKSKRNREKGHTTVLKGRMNNERGNDLADAVALLFI